MSAPESSTSASRLPCASKGSSGLGDRQAGVGGELLAHLGGELGVGVEAGAGGGAAERDLADPAQRRLDPLDAEPDLRRVAAELLAEGDRDRVHQVGAAGLDDVGELLRLRLERRLERAHRRQQVVGDLVERRQVDGGGEDVVGGLAHVDVVVGVGPVAGEVGDHLVGVHVRGGAGAGLEDVDRELVVVLAVGDRVAGLGDPLGEVGVEHAELAVGRRRRRLEPAQPADHRHRHPLAGDREVVDGLGGLATPELLVRGRVVPPCWFEGRSQSIREPVGVAAPSTRPTAARLLARVSPLRGTVSME